MVMRELLPSLSIIITVRMAAATKKPTRNTSTAVAMTRANAGGMNL